MRHSYSIEGYSYSLSPVTTEDAQFIVETRLEDLQRNKFIHTISPDISLQIEWINKYYEVPGDYYFVVINKFTNHKEGLISLYNINDKKAEWGRWVIRKDSLASVESFYLICRIAFEQLFFDEIFSLTITDNKKVVDFHDSVNARRIGIIPECFTINNITYDAVKHIVDKELFFTVIKPKLDKILNLMFQKNNKTNI